MSDTNNKSENTKAYTATHLSNLPRDLELTKEVDERFINPAMTPHYFFDAEDLIEVLKKLPKGTKVLVPNEQGESTTYGDKADKLFTDHGRVTVHSAENQHFAVLKSVLHWQDVERTLKEGVAEQVGY